MDNRVILTPFFLDREEPSFAALAQADWTVNRPPLEAGSDSDRMTVIHEALAGTVASIVRGGARPVSIAGDCCGTIGVLAGLQRAGLDPVLLWLDAHGDFNTHETTITGFVGGMPLAMIVGRGNQTMVNAVGMRPVDEADVVLSDARDLDPGERVLLDESRVRRIADVESIASALPTDRPIYVHFDADVLRPDDAPSMKYSVAGGPSLAAAERMASAIWAHGCVVAASMTLWRVKGDQDGRTARACLSVLGRLIDEPALSSVVS